MLDLPSFLQTYKLTNEKLGKAQINEAFLQEIYDKYNEIYEELNIMANRIFDVLRQLPNVHTVRYRVKDTEHLLEKIIRKRLDGELLDLTPDNFQEKITDLIGLRILHLYKDDWRKIHSAILDNYKLKSNPIVNYRKGDLDAFLKEIEELNLDKKEHPGSYRSIHYTVLPNPETNFGYEIQVRTIMEEAWSEIDHQVRYPYDLGNKLYSEYLSIFNRLIGTADEMGTFLKKLKNEIDSKNNQIENLMQQISELPLTKEEKAPILESVLAIENSSTMEYMSMGDALYLIKRQLEGN